MKRKIIRWGLPVVNVGDVTGWRVVRFENAPEGAVFLALTPNNDLWFQCEASTPNVVPISILLVNVPGLLPDEVQEPLIAGAELWFAGITQSVLQPKAVYIISR